MKERNILFSFLAILVLFSLFNTPLQNNHAEPLPTIYSRISGIVWPFNFYTKTAPAYANDFTFQTEFTFQLINPSSSDVAISNNCTILFILNVSAELFEGKIDTSTDTSSCPYSITYYLVPGVTNLTVRQNIYFHNVNITSFPLGEYTLTFDLVGEGDFNFYAYKLFLNVTEDFVVISQEDGSFEIEIINEKETEETTNLAETPIAYITAILGLLLVSPLIIKYKKRRNRT